MGPGIGHEAEIAYRQERIRADYAAANFRNPARDRAARASRTGRLHAFAGLSALARLHRQRPAH